MPFSIDYDSDLHVMHVQFTGEVGLADCLEMLAIQRAHPEFQQEPRMLCDVTGTRSSLAFEGLWQVFEFVREHIDEYRDSTCAVVAPEALQYGVARMAATIMRGLPLTVRVFRDAETARLWLRTVPVAAGA